MAAGGYAASALVFDDPAARFTSGVGGALLVGIGKEVYDAAGGGQPSWRDLTWDLAGALTGGLVALAVDHLLFDSSSGEAAVLRDQDMGDRRQIQTSDAPAAIGPYSQAVSIGELIFCSGQVALDPATGEMVTGGIEAETRRVLANLGAVLRAAGVGPAQVVKTTIYLADMADFTTVNSIYAEVFGANPPARATVQVAALPKGARVEIDAIAVRAR